VTVTAALHFTAGRALLSLGSFAAAVAILAPPAYCLGDRQRGIGVTAAACALAQSGLHVWFLFASGHVHHLVPGPTMLLAHTLAMAVTARWLARGDAALAAFLELLILAFGPGLWLRLLEAAGPVLPPRRTVPSPDGTHTLTAAGATGPRGC
jgi:hypothetical protein